MSKFSTMEDLANRIENERPDILEAMKNSEIEHGLAKQILERRKSLMISQQQLTKRAHLTQCQVSRLEKGDIKSFSTLKRVLNALDLEILIVPKHSPMITGHSSSKRKRRLKLPIKS